MLFYGNRQFIIINIKVKGHLYYAFNMIKQNGGDLFNFNNIKTIMNEKQIYKLCICLFDNKTSIYNKEQLNVDYQLRRFICTMAKKERKMVRNKDEDIKNKIEIATQILDRQISFVEKCDNKTSILLGIFGVLFTIVFTSDVIETIIKMIDNYLVANTFCRKLYSIFFIISIVLFLIGFSIFVSVLFARTSEKSIGNNKKEEKSLIFFKGIMKVGSFNRYKQRFYEMNNEELLDYLIEQIYINADIANNKYDKYNCGILFTILGFVLYIVLLLAGTFIY